MRRIVFIRREQASGSPESVDESSRPTDSAFCPFDGAIEGAIGNDKKSDGIGPVSFDHSNGVDGVPFGFAHFFGTANDDGRRGLGMDADAVFVEGGFVRREPLVGFSFFCGECVGFVADHSLIEEAGEGFMYFVEVSAKGECT